MGVLSLMGLPIRLFQRTWSSLLPSNDSRTVLALPVTSLIPSFPHVASLLARPCLLDTWHLRRTAHSCILYLQVAGLDEAQAHQILSTLRAAAVNHDVSAVPATIVCPAVLVFRWRSFCDSLRGLPALTLLRRVCPCVNTKD